MKDVTVTLSATDALKLEGIPAENDGENNVYLTFTNTNISLSGKNITVGQYVRFADGFDNTITFTSNKGEIIVGGEDYVTDFKLAKIMIGGNATTANDVKKPDNITFTKCKFNTGNDDAQATFTSYWGATFKECVLQDNFLNYAWFKINGDKIYKDEQVIIYTLDKCNYTNNSTKLLLTHLENLIGNTDDENEDAAKKLDTARKKLLKIHYIGSPYGDTIVNYNQLQPDGLTNDD